MKKEIIHAFYAIAMGLLGTLGKDDVDDSENASSENVISRFCTHLSII